MLQAVETTLPDNVWRVRALALKEVACHWLDVPLEKPRLKVASSEAVLFLASFHQAP